MKKVIEKFGILIAYVIYILLVETACVFALEQESVGFDRSLVIRQETYETNGIRIYRPVPLDERIMNIVVNNNIRSFEDYIHWLQENIKYARDEEGDYWLSPEETLRRKRADCEDYTFLNAAVLRVLGYQPKTLAMGGLGGNHAICVFEENGYYSWIDNAKLKRTQAQSMPEFAKYLFAEYGCAYLLQLNLETKDWDILFKRSEMTTM